MKPKPIPLLDYVGTPLFAAWFLFVFVAQRRRPLRRQRFAAWPRLVRNFVLSAPAFLLLRLALIPVPLAAARWAARRRLGLLPALRLPGWATLAGGFLLLDWAYYWWHVALHQVPLLWRFHNVHHSDLDMDVSTAARFHFGEIIFSVPYRIAVAVLAGVPTRALLWYELAFESASLFHHSNWRLPRRVERGLNAVLVTPRLHGIHHSVVRTEADSNWGTVFVWWDRLHRTLRRDVAQDELTIGVPAYRDERELTVGQLLTLPFRRQRDWRWPDGRVPVREPRR